ncbi:hypothetical protein ABTX62_12595 [Streptomyces sp. NPDC096046]|uniref:hypothetical protein n=1 Tax=Streptomyces sp. NPDC096046 TaxID=3155542 RepID=UPI003330904D
MATSPAFVADARLTVTGAHELTGESRVRSTLAAGSYAVRVDCGDTRRTGTLTVHDDARHRPGAAPVPGVGEQPPVPGEGEQSTVSGEDGQPSVPGSAGQEPAPGEGGQPSVPESAGQEPALREGGEPSVPGADESSSFSSHRPGAPASPVAPVQAGGGGAAALIAAEDRGNGPGTAQGVTGLVLAGVAAVVVAWRGVRRRRGTD